MSEVHKHGVRHRRESGGEYCYKRAYYKVVVGGKTFKFDFKAPAGQGYNAACIDKLTERVIDYIDEKFPRLEFKQVDILPNQINFIAIGARAKLSSEVQASQAQGPSSLGDGGASDNL